MLVARAQWLPNYHAEAIQAARERLRQHEINGTRVQLREGWQGAARLPIQHQS